MSGQKRWLKNFKKDTGKIEGIEKVENYFFENLVEIVNEDWLDEDKKIEKRDIESTLKKKFGIYIEYPKEITVEFFIEIYGVCLF